MLEKQILHADLCIVGGGLAGMCAAIAAHGYELPHARTGNSP